MSLHVESPNKKSAASIMLHPAEGNGEYRPGDKEAICANTPIDQHDLPWFMWDFEGIIQRPPKLWLGWSVDPDRMLDIIQECMPEAIMYRNGKKDLGIDVSYTLLSENLSVSIARYLDLPPEAAPYIFCVPVFRSDASTGWALTVGHNWYRMLPEDERDKIGQMFAPNGKLQWHLGLNNWQWTRRPGRWTMRQLVDDPNILRSIHFPGDIGWAARSA